MKIFSKVSATRWVAGLVVLVAAVAVLAMSPFWQQKAGDMVWQFNGQVTLAVDYSEPIEKLFRDVPYRECCHLVYPENFPHESSGETGVAEVQMKLFHFQGIMTTSEVKEVMERRGWRAATFRELLEFGRWNWQHQHCRSTLVALGSIWQDDELPELMKRSSLCVALLNFAGVSTVNCNAAIAPYFFVPKHRFSALDMKKEMMRLGCPAPEGWEDGLENARWFSNNFLGVRVIRRSQTPTVVAQLAP